MSGVHIESDLRLTSLPFEPAASDAPDLRLRVVNGASPAPAGDVLQERTIDGVPWLTVARSSGGYLMKVHGFADFTLDAARAEITCAIADGCAPEVIEQLFIDQIFPLALHAAGRFSFHASSVMLPDGGVIAFLGTSGRGKSTLAASLSRAPHCALFSDDCLAVTKTEATVLVYPSYPSSRLWAPAAQALFREQGELPLASPRTEKRRVALPAERAPRPLRRIYLLEQSDAAPTIERLRRRDALAALAAHLHRLDVQDRARLAEEISLLEQVVNTVPVGRLSYRRSFAEIPAVHAVIRADTAGDTEP